MWKFPWNSYKPHFGEKSFVYIHLIQHQPTEANCLVNGPKPHVKSIKSGAGIGPACTHQSDFNQKCYKSSAVGQVSGLLCLCPVAHDQGLGAPILSQSLQGLQALLLALIPG